MVWHFRHCNTTYPQLTTNYIFYINEWTMNIICNMLCIDYNAKLELLSVETVWASGDFAC